MSRSVPVAACSQTGAANFMVWAKGGRGCHRGNVSRGGQCLVTRKYILPFIRGSADSGVVGLSESSSLG